MKSVALKLTNLADSLLPGKENGISCKAALMKPEHNRTGAAFPPVFDVE